MFRLSKVVIFVTAVLAVSSFELGDQDVLFHLFTRQNPGQSQVLLPALPSIMTSNLSLQRLTIITCHDYGESVGGNFNAFVVPAHLSAQDVNLLAVDWSAGASMYTQGLGNAPQVGRAIAEFVNILHTQFGYPIDMVRIVGVGLGGHIAGIAARNIQGNVPHIVALDPALNGWSHNPERLSPNDADVVEVLHVTAGLYGYDRPLGDIDFYPNGGSIQAGCVSGVACSHTFGYVFYAESLQSEVNDGVKFVGTACDDWEQATRLQCTGANDAYFGGTTDKSGVSGVYTFLTNPTAPHARG